MINDKIRLPEPRITNECGPEALVAISNYYKKDIKLIECVKAIYSEKLGGTPSTQLAPYIRNLGFKATLKEGSIGLLKNSIDKQTPLIIMIDVSPSKSKDAFHYFIVVGYSDRDNSILCQYYEKKYYAISYSELTERWKNVGNFCLEVVKSDADSEFEQAAELENKGDYRKALRHFKKATEKDPNHFLSYVGLGNMYLAMDNLQEAIIAYQKAYALNREDRKVLNALANIYVELGIYLNDAETFAARAIDKYNEHIENLKREITKNPEGEVKIDLDVAEFEFAQVYGTLGEARLAKGKFLLAISTFEKAIEMVSLPQFDFRAKRYYEISIAYYGLRKPKEARENLEKALAAVKDPQLKAKIEKALKELPSILESK